jgi:hypothetical protein
MVPSTLNGEKEGVAGRCACRGSNRKWCRQAGQTVALSRIVARQ